MEDYYTDFDFSPYSSYGSYSSSSPVTSADAITSFGAAVSAILATFAFLFLALFAIAIVVLIARWKLFKKANRKPWESLIPIHSAIVELELGGIETYWFFLNYAIIIPFIGLLLGWIPIIALNFWRCIALAKSFGKSTGFGVMMGFFPFIGYPMLAFGNTQYIGPQTNTNSQNYSNNNYNNFNNTDYNNNPNSYSQPNTQQYNTQQYNTQTNYNQSFEQTNPTQQTVEPTNPSQSQANANNTQSFSNTINSDNSNIQQ